MAVSLTNSSVSGEKRLGTSVEVYSSPVTKYSDRCMTKIVFSGERFGFSLELMRERELGIEATCLVSFGTATRAFWRRTAGKLRL